MNRKITIVIALIAALLMPAALRAQKGLNINGAFAPAYRDMKGATETLIIKDRLTKMNLDRYHSITFTDHPELAAKLERMVIADGKKAVSKEVRYKSGHLYYGFYRLSPIECNVNRYILYLNGHLAGDNRIVLLYLEGKASPDKVKEMLK